MFCDPDYKNQIYSKIENTLKSQGQLKGEALTQMMKSLKSQYEAHLKRPENQMNLKKFVQIASKNLNLLKNSSEKFLAAGKLHYLLFQYKEIQEKEFNLPFFATLDFFRNSLCLEKLIFFEVAF